MNWETKKSWLQRNPVTVTRHIDYIFEQLWGKVLLSGSHPIGQILNYDLRKEMQGRGTAHFHAAIRVLGAPKLDIDPDQSFIDFADKHISCSLPDRNSRDRYTTIHAHVKGEKAKPAGFFYPKPPCNATIIARASNQTSPGNDDNAIITKEAATNILTKMFEYLTTTLHDAHSSTLEDILSTINISKEDYEAALKVSHRRTKLVMKRTPQDVYVNNYNPTILKCLRSNMDIQMITFIWACIAYITSCKPEKKHVRTHAQSKQRKCKSDYKGQDVCYCKSAAQRT